MGKGILVGILLGLLISFGAVYFYFSTGQAPVATTSADMPFERKFARMAQRAYMDRLPHPNPAVPQDEPNFIEGAKVYKEYCAVCHGLPGEPKTMIAEGMYPKPPQLFQGVGVTDDEPWETYWKVSSGIRLTGMPGFKDRLGDTKVWQVSVLLKNADKLSPSVKTELVPMPASVLTAPATLPVPANPAAPAKPDDHDHVH